MRIRRFGSLTRLKLFEKYGLETELVYVSGARPIQAMLGGSIDVSQVGGAATVAAAAQGADIAIRPRGKIPPILSSSSFSRSWKKKDSSNSS